MSKNISQLATKYLPIGNHSGQRTQKIKSIVIHHNAGINTVETLQRVLINGGISSNYGIGNNGEIACYVDESKRAWTTGGNNPDQYSITIEVSNDSGGPNWTISNKAMQSLIKLVADIVRRYNLNLTRLYTGDKSGVLLMHKWFTATACPGPYLSSKFPYISTEVKKLIKKFEQPKQTANKGEIDMWKVQVGAFKNKANAERRAKELNSKGYATYIIWEDEKPQPKPRKTTEQLAREVLDGKHGNGEARRKSLGNRYAEVQAEVNRLLGN